MRIEHLERLLSLGVVAAIAIGVVWLLLRREQGGGAAAGMLLGYPAHRFPVRDLAAHAQLTRLAAMQARLLGLYRRLPPHSDTAIWLLAFLKELRQVMDRAYVLARALDSYGLPPQLEQVVGELGMIEQEIALLISRQLLEGSFDMQSRLFEEHMPVLRLCARKLAGTGG